MIRVLRNVTYSIIDTNYHGRKYHIGAKATIGLDDQQDEQCADYLLQTYRFLKEITPKNIPVSETKLVAIVSRKGKIIKKKVFVAKMAIPKKGRRKYDFT